MDNKTLLILAAGMGSRYGGNKQREIVSKPNATIMDYSIYDALQCGFNKVVFLIRQDFASDFQAEMQAKWGGKLELHYAYQDVQDIPVVFLDKISKRQKPWGTAHALICANRYLNEPFVVVNADDYYGREAFQLASEKLYKLDISEAVGVLYSLERTLSAHGTVNRGICQVDKMGLIQEITETFNICKDRNGAILDGEENELDDKTRVSMNFWLFHPTLIPMLAEDLSIFLERYASNERAEFLLPNCLNHYIKTQVMRVRAIQVDTEWFGITYREDLPYLSAHLAKLRENGFYPQSIFD